MNLLKHTTIGLLAASSLLISAESQAVAFDVDSVVHGVWGQPTGNTPLNTGPLSTGLAVNIGDTVTISSDINDTWMINGQVVNARGTLNVFGPGNTTNQGGRSLSNFQWGSLAYSIGNVMGSWGATYTDPDLNDGLYDTSVSFVAASAGTLYLAMWDSVVSDNGGADTTITANVTITSAGGGGQIPEPMTLALFGLGLVGIAARSKKRKI